MELRVKQITLPEAIEFNFEELKNEITARTSAYVGIVYTDDQIKDAKKDVAMLRKFTKALSDERIRVKKEILKPYDEFETKVKELSGIVETAIADIDKQIKTFDAIKQDEKRLAIEEMFKDMLFPEFVKLDEKIFDPKWLNASTSMQSIEESLLNTKDEIKKNCQTLATLPMYSHEALIYYQKTLDITGAIGKVRELTDIEEAKKKMLAEEKAAEPEEPKMWVGFKANISKSQAARLKAFFIENGIDFRPLKISEE